MKWIIALLFSLSASATLNNVDKANIVTKNLLVNAGFENGKATWTASGGSFAIVTSGSNLLEGGASATWDASSAAQTLGVASVTIPNGLYGKAGIAYCTILTPSGTATHTIDVTDGSNVLSSATIASNTNPIRTYTSFVFPISGSILLRVSSVASNEPSISIDDCYLGSAEGVSLAQFQNRDIFSAILDYTTSPVGVSGENVDWINGTCVRTATGTATCTAQGGIFTTTPICWGACVEPQNGARNCMVTFGDTSGASTLIFGVVNGAGTALNNVVQVSCMKTSVDTPSAAYKIDTLANSWSGYHDNTCSWARTNAAYGDPTADATCVLTERTNNNFGTVTTYTVTNPEPGIVFTPKRAGRYFVKASIKWAGGGLGAHMDARLWDGTTTIAEEQEDAAVAADIEHLVLSGIYVASSTAAVTLSIQTKASTGAVTIAASGSTNASAVEWTIFAIDQQFPSPAIQNAVVSPVNNGVRIASARLNCDAGSAITYQDGAWISAIGNISAGACAVTIAASTFTTAPVCTVTEETGASGDPFNVGLTTAPTTTALSIDCANNAGTDCTAYDFELICVGAK